MTRLAKVLWAVTLALVMAAIGVGWVVIIRDLAALGPLGVALALLATAALTGSAAHTAELLAPGDRSRTRQAEWRDD